MKIRKWAVAAAVLGGLSGNACAQFADSFSGDFHATVGVRAWHTEWTTWYYNQSIGFYDQYEAANLNWNFIPVVSVSKGRWFVAGSYQSPNTFKWDYPAGVSFRRKEWDANVGYFIVPGLAVTLGYKEIEYRSGNYVWTSKGPTIGLAGNAAIQSWVSLYGNLAYSRPRINDVVYFSNSRGYYMLTEFGFAFPLGGYNDALGGAVVTAGYRYQRIGADPNSSFNTFLPAHRKQYETTQGPVIGVAFRF